MLLYILDVEIQEAEIEVEEMEEVAMAIEETMVVEEIIAAFNGTG